MPRARELGLDAALHVDVAEARLRQPEPSIQIQSIDDILLARRQQERRRQLHAASHWCLRGFDRQLEHVFDARVANLDIERDMPPLHVALTHDGA